MKRKGGEGERERERRKKGACLHKAIAETLALFP